MVSYLKDGFVHVQEIVEVLFRFIPLSRFVKDLGNERIGFVLDELSHSNSPRRLRGPLEP